MHDFAKTCAAAESAIRLYRSALGTQSSSLNLAAYEIFFRAGGEKSNEVLTIPDWPQTPEAVGAAIKDAIAKGNAALDEIGKQDFSKVTFKTTVVALDDLTYEAGNAGNKAVIIKETNTSPAMRTAAENAVKAYQDWTVGIDYREDVYKAIKAFADTHPKLTGEDEKLFNETLRDYRRAGLDLPPEKRQDVEKLRKELSKMETDFSSNIVAAKVALVLRKLNWKACRKASSIRPA